MTIWAEKVVDNSEWGRVHDKFERHFMALGAPTDMMLIWVPGPADQEHLRLIMALPDGATLDLYPGFAKIEPEALPKVASLVEGHPISFEELFEYPKV